MTQDEVFRIVNIFKNDGVDSVTGKKISERAVWELLESIDKLMGYDEASEVIFAPEDFGLNKEATVEEIVNYIWDHAKIE